MNALRFLPSLATLGAAQTGLFLVLARLYLPRPDQGRGRIALGLAQAVVAAVFIGFLFASRKGIELHGWLRFVIEPLLLCEVLSLPLLVLLGVPLSLARRLQPRAAHEPDASRRPDAARAQDAARDADIARRPGAAREPGPELLEPRRLFLARAATGLLGGTAALSAYGISEAERDPELTRRDIFLPGLPAALDGLTLLQLSDIHTGAFMTEARLARIARQAATLNADLVVLTGDLIDVSEQAAPAFTRAMRDLHGRLGTYAILGNHDYLASARAVERAVRDAGMTFLRNSGARVERGGASLWIGGVDDPSRDSPGGPGPALALRGAAPEEKRIMLAHRPQLFEECAGAGSDLVLSGHTHGGQVALSSAWSFARLLGPYTMGHYRKGASQLYVHRGMGTVGPAPLRLGSPPEIALLTLRRS